MNNMPAPRRVRIRSRTSSSATDVPESCRGMWRRRTMATATTSLTLLLSLAARAHGQHIPVPAPPAPTLVEIPSLRRDLQDDSFPWGGRLFADRPGVATRQEPTPEFEATETISPFEDTETNPPDFGASETPPPSALEAADTLPPVFDLPPSPTLPSLPPALPPGVVITGPPPSPPPVATPEPSPPQMAIPTLPPVITCPPAFGLCGPSGTSPNPTTQPTSPPSRPPSLIPSDAPSLVPSGRPSRKPTIAPSRSPTARPTAMPSKAPTRKPTPGPTPSPSTSPTAAPTQSPTLQPSPEPSKSPTLKPSSSPSKAPAGQPSSYPSAEPTSETPKPTISPQPTGKPSATPTNYPSQTPTLEPTSEPSVAPSPAPTPSPSQMPTLEDQIAFVPLEMTLMSTRGPLAERTKFDYQSATAGHIKQTIKSMNLDLLPDTLSVDVRFEKQLPRNVTSTRFLIRRRLRRNLQSLYWLTVTSSVRVEFKSPTVHSPLNWVSESFNSPEKRDLYITRLKQSSPDFSDVNSVGLLVDGFVPIEVPEEQDPGGDDSSAIDLPIIVGAAAAGALVMALIIFFLMRRSARDDDRGHSKKPHEVPSTAASTGNGPLRVSTEICVERQDDISTLGDPNLGGMAVTAAGAADRDERTASVGDDYDYAKEYLLRQHAAGAAAGLGGAAAVAGGGMGATGLLQEADSSRSRFTSADSGKISTNTPFTRVGSGPMGASVFSDDASFEQQYSDQAGGPFGANERFEVVVPPGKLGMVIDTPGGGVPVVHAIKAESVLSSKVSVGDRLVLVDDEDVTRMTAVQVSKLISLKSREQRILVFLRNPARLQDR